MKSGKVYQFSIMTTYNLLAALVSVEQEWNEVTKIVCIMQWLK